MTTGKNPSQFETMPKRYLLIILILAFVIAIALKALPSNTTLSAQVTRQVTWTDQSVGNNNDREQVSSDISDAVSSSSAARRVDTESPSSVPVVYHSVNKAELTTDIDATDQFINDREDSDNGDAIRSGTARPVNTQSPPTISFINASESQINRAEQPAAATESVAVRNLSPTEKAPEKLYAAMADPPPGCQEAHCTEYLTAAEKKAMKRCGIEAKKSYHHTPSDDSLCNFMDSSRGRLPVALISPPGSGNTWVRGLLERASGICTGSVYCDVMFRKRGFIGENIKSGSCLVVKTHSEKPFWYLHQAGGKPKSSEKRFGSAIYIIRNLYNSAIAEWSRLATNIILIKNKIPHNESHTNVLASEYFTGECSNARN